VQPACLSDAATKLLDCGNWAVSGSWQVPANATSGIYFAKVVRTDTGGASHIVFVVRDDASASDVLFKTSDTTWQAYNSYGGDYIEFPSYGFPTDRAFKASYNRPFTTRARDDGLGSYNWLFHSEYPMVRWLEANGYDLSYFTSVDADRSGSLILNHKVFLSVGHDEYWSGVQRANVEAARDGGVNLAFFSGNEVYRKIRWENSIDGSGTAYRTMVCYKESNAEQKIDPVANVWTGSWRDARTVNPEGPKPENALTGTLFGAMDPPADTLGVPLIVPEANGKLRFWRNTPVASLAAGQTAALGERVVGYEFDEDIDNGFRPAGLVQLSSTTTAAGGMVEGENIFRGQDIYPAGTATHVMTLYRATGGGLVFSAGTVQWSWGLDGQHDNGASTPNASMRQATVNLLADLGAQPGTLQAGLVAATASTDTVAPTSAIVSPSAGATLTANSTVLITGTAVDTGGGVVGGVEVSVDGGTNWKRATGQGNWRYSWTTPGVAGPVTIRSRAVDDSGNVENPSAGLSVTVGGSGPISGPGGPILLLTSASNPFSTYYAEILWAEGLNLFAVADIGTVSPATLANHDVVILGETPLTTDQVTTLSDWVNGGGRLIAMRPDKKLAGLLGLTDAGSTLAEAYVLINTAQVPGNGLVGETIQFHGTADRYALNGATSLATLYSNSTTATTAPAVTLRSVGSGQVAAFTFDLARSVVYTRQGNPAWSGQERDGVPPIRPDDLFFGAAAGDPRPDWIDLNKVAIPQADEQQRLLANLVLSMNQSQRPLPRFWYFPRKLPAVVVMTGDEHAGGNTPARFNEYLAASPSGCLVDNWECIRATAYVYPTSSLGNAQAAAYAAQGFEVALHAAHSADVCTDYTPTSLEQAYASQLSQWASVFPSLSPPQTNRTHCIVWSDYATQPQVAFNHGIRLDTNYYYWPPDWVSNRPGFFTGSGMPMRFAKATGEMIDVYQAVTQMTDESGQTFPFNIDTLLDRAIGEDGYYGAFTANMHHDGIPLSAVNADAIVASAKARGIPVVSARQMLQWLDGRNGSSFGNITWNDSVLEFTITVGTGATGLQAMVPVPQRKQVIVTAGGSPVAHTMATVKGVAYAFFPAANASYRVTFGDDATAPTVASVSPAPGATGVSTGAIVSAIFSEGVDPASVGPATFELRDGSNALVPRSVTYNALTQTAVLVPASPLNVATPYTATIKTGVTDLAGNVLASDRSWSFTTVTPNCPCSLWSSATAPGNPDSGDPNAVELGVKFRSDIAGFITAIRFYKGPADSGSHVVNLWTNSGTLLASVPVTGETASGWQQVALPSPVAIAANTVYVASYHTTVGRYPADGAYFTLSRDSNVLHAPASSSVGGNGVFLYGAGGFPTNTFNATNYWVDVVFMTTLPSDTTSPSVAMTAPANGATVSGAAVTVSASATDNVGVASVQLLLDGAPIGAPDTTAPYSISWDSTAVANGTHTLSARAADAAGNATTATAVTVTVANADTMAPTVSSVSPASLAAGVNATTAVTVTFSEEVNPATVNSSTFVLRDLLNNPVQAAVAYGVGSRTATLTPSSPLSTMATYTATVKGGADGVKDAAGNALAADFPWMFTTAQSAVLPPETTVFSAVLPASRSAVVGSPVTVFATMINAGASSAAGCGIALPPGAPAGLTFLYQTTHPATNQVTGIPNTPVNIAPGASQSFVLGLTPSAPFAPVDLPLTYDCDNSSPTGVLLGINTLLISASLTPVPDVIALAATLSNDGIVDIPGANGAGAFAVASVNVGLGGVITVAPDTGGTTVPVTLSICETNPVSGQCLQAPSGSVTTTIGSGATPTFGIFVSGTGSAVAFNPAVNRVFVRFREGVSITGTVRGATSVAVRTQ
jgi:hypothetical protein